MTDTPPALPDYARTVEGAEHYVTMPGETGVFALRRGEIIDYQPQPAGWFPRWSQGLDVAPGWITRADDMTVSGLFLDCRDDGQGRLTCYDVGPPSWTAFWARRDER